MIFGKLDTMVKLVRFLDVPFVKIDKMLCSSMRLKDSCSKCKDICPVNALEVDTDISIDERYCVKCGACATACDNGVFRMLEISDEGIISRITELSSQFESITFECDGCNKMFRIRHKKIPKDVGRIILPCLGRVDEIILLRCHELGFKDFYFSECNEKCPFKKAREGLGRSRFITGHLVKSLNISPERKIKTADLIKTLRHVDENQIHERRDFLFESGKRAARIALNRDRTDEKHKGFRDPRINPKRETLISFVNNHGVEEYVVSREGIPFADIEISDACDLCGVCTSICPTGALWLEDDQTNSCLKFDFSRCVGCGLCERICHKSAILIKDEVNLGDLVREPVALRTMPLTDCNKCGTGFISVLEAELCSNCAKADNLMSDFMKGKIK